MSPCAGEADPRWFVDRAVTPECPHDTHEPARQADDCHTLSSASGQRERPRELNKFALLLTFATRFLPDFHNSEAGGSEFESRRAHRPKPSESRGRLSLRQTGPIGSEK